MLLLFDALQQMINMYHEQPIKIDFCINLLYKNQTDQVTKDYCHLYIYTLHCK